MITELFGLPGSGKTTLANKMVADEGYTVVSVTNRRELLWLNLRYLLRHPVNFFVTLGYIVANSSDLSMLYYKFMNFFLDVNARYQKACRHPKAVLDQGYFQNILSVFEHEINAGALRRYMRFLLKPDKLMVLEAQRMPSYGWRERRGRAYFEQWQKVMRKNYETFLHHQRTGTV